MSALLIAFAFTASADAASLGNPGRTTASGIFGAQASLDQSFQTLDLESAGACVDYCEAVSWVKASSARVSLRPVDFLGVWAEAGWAADVLNGVEHSASGVDYSGGLHLLMPRHGVKPALSARGRWMNTSSPSGDDGIASDNRAFALEGAAFAVFGDDGGGGNLWLGPIATLASTHDVAVYTDDSSVRLNYSPRFPLGAVVGGEMISSPLSGYLRARSPRMSAGLEVRMLDAWAATGWIGVSY